MTNARKASPKRPRSRKQDAYFDLDISRLALFIDHGLPYFIDPKHPLAGPKTGWVSLLRHRASVKRKRWLEPHEIVTAGLGGRLIVTTRAESARSLQPNKRLFNPSKDELKAMVWKMPMTQVAKHYGVSDVAVKKRCKVMGIETPPRGYWLTTRNDQT